MISVIRANIQQYGVTQVNDPDARISRRTSSVSQYSALSDSEIFPVKILLPCTPAAILSPLKTAEKIEDFSCERERELTLRAFDRLRAPQISENLGFLMAIESSGHVSKTSRLVRFRRRQVYCKIPFLSPRINF